MTQPDVEKPPLLLLENISKVYPGVVALSNVTMAVKPGEVLALIGENGAGKSTLMKILGGVIAPSSGRIIIDNVAHDQLSVTRSQAAGIAFVHQELNVFDNLDVAANMFLGREKRRAGPLGSVLRMLDHGGMKKSAGEAMADLGIGTLQNMGQAVETLSGGQRQAVAVARAAAFASKLIVLDEPTAALGVRETNQVLSMINRVKESGLPVILISHNMPNVFEIADRIHIQRLGRCAGVITPQSHTPNEAVAIMTGATTLAETPGRASA